MTKQNGVDVWPNAAIWMRDELGSKVRLIVIALGLELSNLSVRESDHEMTQTTRLKY